MIKPNVATFMLKTVAPGGLMATASAQASAAGNATLNSNDFVGISFWVISMALIAATAFFFLERDRVAAKWKTSLRRLSS